MIDLDQITGFDWDDGNSRKSADKLTSVRPKQKASSSTIR